MIKKWLRQKILGLIANDIERLARDAYYEGCYVTGRQLSAQKQLEFAHLMAENEKLREMLTEKVSLHMPEIRINGKVE